MSAKYVLVVPWLLAFDGSTTTPSLVGCTQMFYGMNILANGMLMKMTIGLDGPGPTQINT